MRASHFYIISTPLWAIQMLHNAVGVCQSKINTFFNPHHTVGLEVLGRMGGWGREGGGGGEGGKEGRVERSRVTNWLQYNLFAVHSVAYERGKKEKPPFIKSLSPDRRVSEERLIPGELLCTLCSDLLTDAVVIPCCGNSYCDECKLY